MPAEVLQPFPPIPLELKAEILSHADTDTLAKACSVSLAFLQMAAPLLYRDITFVGPKGLEKFLTLRADTQVPELAPYLDQSLVQLVTYIDDEINEFAPDHVAQNKQDLDLLDAAVLKKDLFVPFRLLPFGTKGPTFLPLRVHTLQVQLSGQASTDLWKFFDPVVIRIKGGLRSAVGYPAVFSFVTPENHRWTRLRELECIDATGFEVLFDGGLKTGPVRVRLELSAQDGDIETTVGPIALDAGGSGLKGDDNISEVIIEVRTEALERLFLGELTEIRTALLARTTVLVKPA